MRKFDIIFYFLAIFENQTRSIILIKRKYKKLFYSELQHTLLPISSYMIHFEIDLALPPECGECLILLLQEIVLSMAISWQLYTAPATIRTKDESASAGIISNIRVA